MANVAESAEIVLAASIVAESVANVAGSAETVVATTLHFVGRGDRLPSRRQRRRASSHRRCGEAGHQCSGTRWFPLGLTENRYLGPRPGKIKKPITEKLNFNLLS